MSPRLEILPVPPDRVAGVWHRAEAHIRSAMDPRGIDTIDDVRDRCIENHNALWLVARGARVVGAAVSRTVEGSAGRACGISFIGGDDVDGWLDELVDAVEGHARAVGCAVLLTDSPELCGRLGFDEISTLCGRPVKAATKPAANAA